MEPNEKILYAVRYLLAKSLDESITPDEVRRLDELIVTDPAARRYYVEFLQVHTGLRRLHEEEAAVRDEADCELLDERLWQQLADHEKSAEAVETAAESGPPPAGPGALAPVMLERRRPSRLSVYSLIISLAAMLVMIVYVHLMPAPNRVVGTLTDAVNCRWAGDSRPLRPGDEVLNTSYRLQSGFVSLTFDSGVRVVVEGPAQFTPLSADRMRLRQGKAYARVPEKAIGFTVDTPESSVVDLGTEFGVAVDSGGSEVHVNRGKVNLVAGRADQPKQSEIVRQNEARKVSADGGTIRSADYKEYLFAQTISSKDNRVEYGTPLSLTDLVLGGNGHGTSRETEAIYGVDSGQTITDLAGEYRTLNRSYRQVPSNPFIDGLFVPDGANQVVSSEGHVFVQCPETSGFYYYDLCFDRDWKYASPVAARYQKQRNLKLDSDVLFLHSNLGVTFDLDAVRRQFPRQSARRFQATAGVLSLIRGYAMVTPEQLAKNYTEFDVWVLVDGQLRAKATAVHWDSLVDLDVPLTPDDRFLSILVTDGGMIRSLGNNANHYDLCGLADMRFEMEPVE